MDRRRSRENLWVDAWGGAATVVMRSPRTLDIEITSRCNLRCRYCYYFDNPAVEYRELPSEEWVSFFDELGSLGVMTVSLAGGEPFMREDLTVLLEGIVRNRMRFSILSNGTLIDDESAAFILNTGRCDYVQVSVDGSGAESHDYCRGIGSFDRALSGIKTLQRHGVNVAVRVTVHRGNVHDLDGVAQLLLEEMDLPSFSTNSAGYLGACRQSAGEVLLTTEERQEAMETLLRLSDRYEGRISAAAGPLAEGKRWRRMVQAYETGEESLPGGGRLTGCGCPSNKLAVRADGVVVPCTMLAHIELGRINVDSLEDIWLNNPDLSRLRTRHSRTLREFEFCEGCVYVPYCTGNCPGLAYTLMGEVDHPSPDACLRRFLEDGGTLPQMREES